MILVWNDAKSFQRHVEAMRSFRLAHSAHPDGGPVLRDMPEAGEVVPSQTEMQIANLAGLRRKRLIVPIWKVVLSPGAQN